MKLLIIGGEAHNTALCEKLAESPQIQEVRRVLADSDAAQSGVFDYRLVYNDHGLSLLYTDKIVRVDFAEGSSMHRRLYGGGRGQMLAKAVGLKRENIVPDVLDATAGLGKDAFVLSTLGCNVRMCERNPIVHALLHDGLLRAANGDEAVRAIIARMHLEERDTLHVLPILTEANRPDVIYLDPMFPEGRRKSAVKKDMAAFHSLIGGDTDADQLLPLALEAARCRVVVKRPRHAPSLSGIRPSLTLEGDSTRFDVYPLRSMAKPSAQA